MSLIFDEYGRPFIILREGQAKSRIKGLEAQKVRGEYPGLVWLLADLTLRTHCLLQSNILAARSVSQILRTSFGPKGAWCSLRRWM